MDEALQIVFDNLDRSPAIEAMIEEKSKKLERFYHHMNDARAIISQSNKSQHTGAQYHVTIEVNVPGKRLAVSKSPGRSIRHEELMPTVNDAFAAMVRQLEDYARKQRGDVKHHETPLQGRVNKIFSDKGYGYISLTDGREVYFHQNSVTGPGFESLETGVPVRVVLAYDESTEGPQASTVELINEMEFIDEPDREARGR